MKYKWLYIGLIFSIMMALVPVSTLAYTNTPHNWGIPRPKMKQYQMQESYIRIYCKNGGFYLEIRRKRYLFNI